MADINLSGSVSTTGTSILGHSAPVFPADADHVLTVAEYTNNFLNVTSGVSLTTTRNLIAPLVSGQSFVVQNNTTGGHAIVVKAASGTGVNVPNGATVSVVCDGTNYVAASGPAPVTAVTASAPLASSGGLTPNLSHNASGVGAGTYTNATVTVEADGHVTAAASGTAPVTAVTASAPLASSGGATPNLSHNASGVGAGTYTNATVTVEADGHVTAAASGAPSAPLPIKIAVTHTGGASTTVVPTGDTVRRMTWYPSTAFSNGATITVTIGGTTFVASGTFDPTDASLAIVDIEPQNGSWLSVPAGAVVTVTVGGAPAAGAGSLIVDYAPTAS